MYPHKYTVTISSGYHTINVWGREDGVLLDKFCITKSGTTPSDLGGAMKREINNDVQATKVTIRATEDVITVGESTILTAEVEPGDVTIPGVTWSILSGESSAYLDEQPDGSVELVGVKAGTVEVKAASKQSPGVSARYTVTVNGKQGVAQGVFLETDGSVMHRCPDRSGGQRVRLCEGWSDP